MDLFCNILFVNILLLTQKNERAPNPVAGSSPSCCFHSLCNSEKSAFSVVRILRLEKISKMDLWKF